MSADHFTHESYATWQFESGKTQCADQLARFVDAMDETVIRAKGIAACGQGDTLLVQAVGSRRSIDRYAGITSGARLVAIGLKSQLNVAALDRLAEQFLDR